MPTTESTASNGTYVLPQRPFNSARRSSLATHRQRHGKLFADVCDAHCWPRMSIVDIRQRLVEMISDQRGEKVCPTANERLMHVKRIGLIDEQRHVGEYIQQRSAGRRLQPNVNFDSPEHRVERRANVPTCSRSSTGVAPSANRPKSARIFASSSSLSSITTRLMCDVVRSLPSEINPTIGPVAHDNSGSPTPFPAAFDPSVDRADQSRQVMLAHGRHSRERCHSSSCTGNERHSRTRPH
jgi:hypothetical protein